MTSLGHDDDIEIDGEVGSGPIGPIKQWQKDNLVERNDSGFQSQDFDSVKLDSGRPLQQTKFPCVSEDITECFEQLNVSESDKEKQISIDEGYDTTSISLGATSHTSSLKNSTQSSDACAIEYSSKARLQIQENALSDIFKGVPRCEAIDIYTQDEDGDTQLHMAIIQLSEPAAFLCISRAPSNEWLNIQNNMCQTTLHLAVITRQLKVVRRLMAAGASVDVRDTHGNTPLHIACREGHQEIVQCLLKPVFYQETLENKYEIPYQRIPQDLEFKNYDGHTCLHLAAQNLHIDVMTLLLKKGAKVNTQDGKSGRTILHYAAETGNRILLDFILKQRKVNINCVTYGGLTPVALAAGRGYGDVVAILKDQGADCSSLYYMDDDSDDESEMYDDFCINGEPVSLR
ncbi:NF-kappa-B inhibitor epsilon-like [Gigantopelta aegis]|uniref:NF-kappa-B inhibitor epsilon-like n=1 Tax=Gigantopelta aegis TaxID=1735272 RepID=UPI001B88A718|nr:NF-kappa-B inhibitor epsilon-like [Gigantopelta aegis]